MNFRSLLLLSPLILLFSGCNERNLRSELPALQYRPVDIRLVFEKLEGEKVVETRRLRTTVSSLVESSWQLPFVERGYMPGGPCEVVTASSGRFPTLQIGWKIEDDIRYTEVWYGTDSKHDDERRMFGFRYDNTEYLANSAHRESEYFLSINLRSIPVERISEIRVVTLRNIASGNSKE